jgi:hypothetical protein
LSCKYLRELWKKFETALSDHLSYKWERMKSKKEENKKGIGREHEEIHVGRD